MDSATDFPILLSTYRDRVDYGILGYHYPSLYFPAGPTSPSTVSQPGHSPGIGRQQLQNQLYRKIRPAASASSIAAGIRRTAQRKRRNIHTAHTAHLTIDTARRATLRTRHERCIAPSPFIKAQRATIFCEASTRPDIPTCHPATVMDSQTLVAVATRARLSMSATAPGTASATPSSYPT